MEPQGFGSNLHRWALALCHASAEGSALLVEPPWIWEDSALCTKKELQSPHACYFQHKPCGGNASNREVTMHQAPPPWVLNPRLGPAGTGQCRHNEREVYSSAVQVLFTRISPKLLAAAERAAADLFGAGRSGPQNLISVHIRWG